MTRFTRSAVERHLLLHHPRCPGALRAEFVELVASRDWEGVNLGKAVGIILTNYVRHRMTDYDATRMATGSRPAARQAVSKEVQEILRSWRA